MKNIFKYIFTAAVLTSGGLSAHAQFYEIANQLPGLIQPALIGGFNYKGFVEADYLVGLGSHNVDFLGFSTSQGFRYSTWFFMGVGIGVDVVFSHTNDDFGHWNGNLPPGIVNHGTMKTGAMIPLFTDFRFNLGNTQKAAFYLDVKIGCSFLASNNYLVVDNGYLTSQQYFYLKPSAGVRIPVSRNGRQAVDIGVTYQLLTSNYWSNWNTNVTLNSLGASVAFEW